MGDIDFDMGYVVKRKSFFILKFLCYNSRGGERGFYWVKRWFSFEVFVVKYDLVLVF